MGEAEKSQILLYAGDLLAEIQHKEGSDKNWRGPTLKATDFLAQGHHRDSSPLALGFKR